MSPQKLVCHAFLLRSLQNRIRGLLRYKKEPLRYSDGLFRNGAILLPISAAGPISGWALASARPEIGLCCDRI